MTPRGATDLCGILPIDKPAGMTSHDVVGVVRRASGERRVGHAGTLDPAATGLLVVLVGPATRLAPYLTSASKTYEATIVFGSETDTADADGSVVREADVPHAVRDPAFAEKTLQAWVGQHDQTPPAYSAVKIAGRKAYDLARAGKPVHIEPRSVEIIAVSLHEVILEPRISWIVEITVSKGFYVRSFAQDLGVSLETAAHLGALRRTASGRLSITSAVDLEVVRSSGDVSQHFVSPSCALELPSLTVSDDQAARVAVGSRFDIMDVGLDPTVPGPFALYNDDVLLGVYRRERAMILPDVVIPGGMR